MREAEQMVAADSSSVLITEQTVRLLGKIAKRPDYQVTSQLTHLYLRLAKLDSKASVDLTTLINDIFLLAERVRGTEAGELLAAAGQELLVYMMKHGGLNPEQLQVAQQLLDKQTSFDFESESLSVIEDLKAGDTAAMLRLFDLMSQCSSLKEQYEIFDTQLSEVVTALQPHQGIPEMQVQAYRFLEHFIFQHSFNVKVGSAVQMYSVMETRYLTEDSFFTAMCFVKLLLVAEVPIKASLLRILKRLWFLFPSRRPTLRDPLIEVLRASAAGDTDQGKTAAKFLFYLRNDKEAEPDLKSILDHDEKLTALEELEEYSTSALVDPEIESTEDLDQLQVFAGFPLSVHISAGESVSYVIEAPEANCILTWGFATKAHDLSYSLSRVDLNTPQVIIDQQRIDCSNEPVVGAVVLQSPGFYKFVWDNTFSWFREKYLRYRITVLQPQRPLGLSSAALKGPIALQGQEDDAFVNPQGEVLEIGVEIKGTHISIMSQNENDELDLETLDELPLAVAGFIERICDPNLVYHRKIGVVQNVFRCHPELDELGSVAVARDVEAVALLSYHSMHPHTLIAVLLDLPFRSAVITRGRLLADEDGNSLGDLSRLPESDPVKAVASLLMMFGPAVVVVAGIKGVFLEFSEQVKEVVPVAIWQHSVLRQSIYGDRVTIEAAFKLQFLRQQYKHTF
jgi:hypothetical protein